MAKSKKISDEEILLKKLGDRIHFLRKEKGKSQNDLALDIDWDKSNLRKIEKGKLNVTVKTLYKLSQALDVELHELFIEE